MPIQTVANAEAAKQRGYATFNNVPHLCVDVPNDHFTISAKTSQGKRVTFYFGPYQAGGPPQFVDVQYHDNGTSRTNGDTIVPTFDAIVFKQGGAAYDTRKATPDGKDKPGIVCILIEDERKEGG